MPRPATLIAARARERERNFRDIEGQRNDANRNEISSRSIHIFTIKITAHVAIIYISNSDNAFPTKLEPSFVLRTANESYSMKMRAHQKRTFQR